MNALTGVLMATARRQSLAPQAGRQPVSYLATTWIYSNTGCRCWAHMTAVQYLTPAPTFTRRWKQWRHIPTTHCAVIASWEPLCLFLLRSLVWIIQSLATEQLLQTTRHISSVNWRSSWWKRTVMTFVAFEDSPWTLMCDFFANESLKYSDYEVAQ